MKHNRALLLVLGLIVAALAYGAPARADVGIGGGALIGTGTNVGGIAENNPYRLQLGGYGELDLGNIMLGIRGTRSVGSDPAACEPNSCRDVDDLRTFGGDFGYIWHLPLLHFGPRLGIGYLDEPNGDDRVGAYFEPGASLDIKLLMFNVGGEIRYRFVAGADDVDGFLAYLRLGLRL
jgi:hypothetical protein